jgi:hypothetical protein
MCARANESSLSENFGVYGTFHSPSFPHFLFVKCFLQFNRVFFVCTSKGLFAASKFVYKRSRV